MKIDQILHQLDQESSPQDNIFYVFDWGCAFVIPIVVIGVVMLLQWS